MLLVLARVGAGIVPRGIAGRRITRTVRIGRCFGWTADAGTGRSDPVDGTARRIVPGAVTPGFPGRVLGGCVDVMASTP
jgi:hypothetical protein